MSTATSDQVQDLTPTTESSGSNTRESVVAEYKMHDPRRKSPFLAGVLSLLPGLGQVYVGYYRRGFINIVVFGSLISLVSSGEGYAPFLPLGVFFLIFFEFYNIIDAGRRATLYNLSLDGIENIALPDELTNDPLPVKGSYLLGGVLLVFGAIALSNTLFGLSLRWLEDFWPVFPMLLGGYLVWKAFQDGRDEKAQDVSDD